MPIPKPILYPPFNVVRISHVTYVTPDLKRLRAFYVDLLGLQVTAETDDSLYLRAMEERGHHSIAFVRGERSRVELVAFKVFADDDLDKAASFFATRSLPVKWVNLPFQGRTLRTTDSQGIPLELYHHMDRLPPIHQKYSLYHGAKPLRIDHCNCFSDNVDAAVDFWPFSDLRTSPLSRRCWGKSGHQRTSCAIPFYEYTAYSSPNWRGFSVSF